MNPAGRKVSEVAEQLLTEVNSVYSKTGKLSDELLSALNFVFQAPLLPALDIIDNRNVTTISCPSGRKVYQVIGTSGTPYICLPSGSYCSCPAYRYSGDCNTYILLSLYNTSNSSLQKNPTKSPPYPQIHVCLHGLLSKLGWTN